MTEAYPLQWPLGKPRAKWPASSKFGTYTLAQVTQFVLREIRLLGGGTPIISTNLRLRLDGLPYSKQAQPQDRGTAVYFTLKGKQMCFACDRWDKIEDNIYAVSKTIEALRGIERWGSGSMVEQAFTGFVALPAPKSARTILGFNDGEAVSRTALEARYREKAKAAHPDAPGGSQAAMTELNMARDELLKGLE